MAPPRRLRVLTRQLCATTAEWSSSEDQASRLDELLAIRAKLDVAIEGLQGGGTGRAEPTAAPDDGMVLRPLEPSDFPAVSALNANVFAKPYPDRVHDWLSSIPPESWDTLCAFAPDGQLACSFWCRHYTMQANGRALPLAGIAGVGTHTDHRRKGLLRRIMTQQFQTMRARGQSCAALWASQAAIYQRYGFSMVTTSRGYTIDTVDVGFADGDPGSVAVTQLPADDPATPAALQAMCTPPQDLSPGQECQQYRCGQTRPSPRTASATCSATLSRRRPGAWTRRRSAPPPWLRWARACEVCSALPRPRALSTWPRPARVATRCTRSRRRAGRRVWVGGSTAPGRSSSS